jgi:hypothetical protein
MGTNGKAETSGVHTEHGMTRHLLYSKEREGTQPQAHAPSGRISSVYPAWKGWRQGLQRVGGEDVRTKRGVIGHAPQHEQRDQSGGDAGDPASGRRRGAWERCRDLSASGGQVPGTECIFSKTCSLSNPSATTASVE